MADDDALLRVALHIDDGIDMDMTLVLFEALHHHLDGVRNLLVVIAQNLLADNLGDEKARGLVGQLVLAEVSRTLGQQLLDALHQYIGAELIRRRDGQYLGVGQQSMPFLDEVAELFGGVIALQHVNLIDEQQHGNLHLTHLLEEVGVFLRLLHHVGDVEQDVGIGQGRLRELQHILLHLVVRLQHARGIGEHNLTVGCVDDAHDTVTGGLRLERRDTNLLADELVHQRRLTDVGVTDDIYETGLMLHNR